MHGGGEGREVLGAQEKGADAADDVFVVIALEPRLARQNGETIDGDAGGDQLVTHVLHRRPDIGDAVAREIDQPAIGGVGRLVEQLARRQQRIADRRQALRAALRQPYRFGEVGGAGRIVDPRPADGDDLLVAIRPFEHGDLDGAASPSGDRRGELGILEGARDTLVLQHVPVGIDALGDVDGHDEGEVDRLRRGAG